MGIVVCWYRYRYTRITPSGSEAHSQWITKRILVGVSTATIKWKHFPVRVVWHWAPINDKTQPIWDMVIGAFEFTLAMWTSLLKKTVQIKNTYFPIRVVWLTGRQGEWLLPWYSGRSRSGYFDKPPFNGKPSPGWGNFSWQGALLWYDHQGVPNQNHWYPNQDSVFLNQGFRISNLGYFG